MTKKLVSLSVQHLVDCDKKNYGCRSGFRDRAFGFIKKMELYLKPHIHIQQNMKMRLKDS
ncbi:hypothetical protein KSP39_PZI018521 [Platanthera zijinensis]|uniref:Peptidase C1A papain C-terminal domain-containing protein n=1 Tax=Platanthera zijinensis TaxID=2320716 RepID=A0AAP0B2H7_9ASPA